MFDVVNTTYYNTEDLVKVLEAAWSFIGQHWEVKGTPKRLRVKYLSSVTVYSDTEEGGWRRRHYGAGHRFSLHSKGWGEILESGDWPRASFTRRWIRGGGAEYILSLVRRDKVFGDDELQKLATASLEQAPSVVVQHLLFALWTHFGTIPRDEIMQLVHLPDLGERLPLRIEKKADAAGKKKANLHKAQKQLAETVRALSDSVHNVESWKKAVEEEEEKVALLSQQVEKLNREIASYE